MNICKDACKLPVPHQAEADVETESDTEFLPDQPINPEEYEPVIATHHRRTQ